MFPLIVWNPDKTPSKRLECQFREPEFDEFWQTAVSGLCTGSPLVVRSASLTSLRVCELTSIAVDLSPFTRLLC